MLPAVSLCDIMFRQAPKNTDETTQHSSRKQRHNVDYIMAGIISLLIVSLGIMCAYLGGAVGYAARRQLRIKGLVTRRQVVVVFLAMGFAAGLMGGVIGAEAATMPYGELFSLVAY